MVMKAETFINKMNAKTANLDGLGGGGFDALIQGDIGAVMMACPAHPLIWSYLFSYYDVGLSYDKFVLVDWNVERFPVENEDGEVVFYKLRYEEKYQRVHVSNSLNEFSRMLEDWVFKNYLECRINQGDDMVKALERATTASEEITHGLASYLSDKPKEEVRIAKYFKPVKPDTFRRKYKSFSIKASRKLFHELCQLCKKIELYIENEQNY